MLRDRDEIAEVREIGSADGLSALLARMEAAPMEVERILPGSAAYRYLT